MRCVLPLPCVAVGAFLGLTLQVHAQSSAKPTLYYIPHTHWEGAVFETREEYLEDGLTHILEALRLMEKYPEYKFALDQVAYFKPFLERYPEQAARFRKYVKEGRLGIVGGMDVMPDDAKVGGELFIRGIQYGKAYCRKALGVDVDVAWMLDTFGHHSQMPQLLKLSGFKSFWFCRGVPTADSPSEFFWKGIDGSTIPTVRLPGFYGLFYGPPRDQKGFDKAFIDNFNSLNANTHARERVGLAGNDVSEPEDYVTPLVRAFNGEPDAPFSIRYSIPSEFAQAVAQRRDTPTFGYDLNPIFPGTYSSRVELRQTAKQLETELLDVEQLGAISNLVGKTTDDAVVWQAWEPVLFNQTHDLASGTMNDHTYADTVKSYDFSRRLADEVLLARSRSLTDSIDTRGSGTAVVVFNPQGWVRTDLAHVDLFFADLNAAGIRVLDDRGQSMPFQVESSERYSDGALRRVKLTFLAKSVPACGYASYRVVTASSGEASFGKLKLAANLKNSRSDGAIAERIAPILERNLVSRVGDATCFGVDRKRATDADSMENEFYKLTVDLKTGAITSLIDKASGETLSGPANVVSRQEDKGDLWALYKTLDGTQFLPNLEPQAVPNSKTALLSTDFSGKAGVIWHGAAYSEFSVSHPFGSGSFSTTIRLIQGVRRVEIETELVNREKHVRYQVLFPTNFDGGSNVQEIPFGAIRRPLSVEYPAANWVDYGYSTRGLAVLNSAMPGNLVSGKTMMLSLMRSVNLGDYNGGDTSDTGFELNVPRKLRYALVPISSSLRQGALAQAGQEFNSPLLAFKAEPHKGLLPSRWGLIQVSSPNVIVTSVKPGPRNSVVVRLYEAAGVAEEGVRIGLGARVLSAVEADLLEGTTGRLAVQGDSVVMNLHAYEIKTIKLQLGSLVKH